jgi:hypothetical protein
MRNYWENIIDLNILRKFNIIEMGYPSISAVYI